MALQPTFNAEMMEKIKGRDGCQIFDTAGKTARSGERWAQILIKVLFSLIYVFLLYNI